MKTSDFAYTCSLFANFFHCYVSSCSKAVQACLYYFYYFSINHSSLFFFLAVLLTHPTTDSINQSSFTLTQSLTHSHSHSHHLSSSFHSILLLTSFISIRSSCLRSRLRSWCRCPRHFQPALALTLTLTLTFIPGVVLFRGRCAVYR